MASSDKLIIGAEAWAFGSSWISEGDTDILTKALQQSMHEHDNKLQTPAPAPAPSSNHQSHSLSSSETETLSTRGPVSAKITKRKPRGSKRTRSPTMFIAADPENFREMVQQLTGIRFCAGAGPLGSVLKPQPHRLQNACLLPTLDTSAFLLDHHQHIVASNSLDSVPSAVGGPAFDFDGFAAFPTLESWN